MKTRIIVILLIITLTIILYPGGGTTRHPQTTKTFTAQDNWIPTDIINNTLEETKTVQITTTPPDTVSLAEVPYSAHIITFTILDLPGKTTITGTATYGFAAKLIGEELYINGTKTSLPPDRDPFIKIMDSIAKILTLTVDEEEAAITNKTITMHESAITANLPNTIAIITLADPMYAEVTYTWPVLTADLRWLRPNVPTTTQKIHLPLLERKNARTIYSDKTLTVYSPGTLNGEIITEYSNAVTLLDALFFDDRVLYNNELLTPDYNHLIATNHTTTVTLSIITRNPPYSLPGTLTCAENDGVFICLVKNTIIAFNSTEIYFSYTTVTNNVTLTVRGWFVYVNNNHPKTTIRIFLSNSTIYQGCSSCSEPSDTGK